ncbi:MAG TPA: SGNH/GDSL hydrolase family protein [Ktedonobacterales bacterium]
MRDPQGAKTPSAGGSQRAGARPVSLLTVGVFSALLLIALIAVDAVTLSKHNPIEALSPHYYMALGNSLSFGYQPNLDFSSGFADDIVNDLRRANLNTKSQPISTEIVNLACAGETTATMINGGCVGQFAHHGSYTGAQLQAALAFLRDPRHQGRVSPITLEVGANDVLVDFDAQTCTVGSGFDADLARMDSNLTDIILPDLTKALTTARGAQTGDLHLLNYYNPYAKACPNSTPFVHEVNDHLQADAAQYRVPIVDIYTAFGGDTAMASHICDYTWYCDPRFPGNIHPTNTGYRIIANAVESALGLPGLAPVIGSAPMTWDAPKPGSGREAWVAPIRRDLRRIT